MTSLTRRILSLGGGWLLPLSLCFAQSGMVSVADFGASPSASATTNFKAIQKAFQQYPNGRILVPPGVYAIDNSTGAIYIENFNGELKFEGDAEFVFQDLSQGGLRFVGGSGARLEGIHTNYRSQPSVRVANVLTFTSTTDFFLKDVIAENSPGAAIWFASSIRPKVTNAHVNFALADGIAFVNSEDCMLMNYTSIGTWDNGLAFYSYSDQPDLNGGFVKNIRITNSNAHGVAIVGPSNVVLSDFVIDTTQGSAVMVGTDYAYAMRHSDMVLVEHGHIRNSGLLPPAPNTNTNANKYGLEYTDPVSCVFSDIEIENSANRAVSGAAANAKIFLRNIRSRSNQSDGAFIFYKTKYVDISDSIAENSPAQGFAFDQVATALMGRLKAVNASQTNSLRRAMWFQNGQFLSAHELLVMDNQTVPTGYIVGASSSTGYNQTGVVQGVSGSITYGAMKVQAYAPNVHFSEAN